MVSNFFKIRQKLGNEPGNTFYCFIHDVSNILSHTIFFYRSVTCIEIQDSSLTQSIQIYFQSINFVYKMNLMKVKGFFK